MKNLLRNASPPVCYLAIIVRLGGGIISEIDENTRLVWFRLPGDEMEMNVALDGLNVRAVRDRIRRYEEPAGHAPAGCGFSCCCNWDFS
jgi:hypothetical protein